MRTRMLTATLLMMPAISAGLSHAQSTPAAPATLYSFAGGDDGQYPVASLVRGPNGTLYGTTSGGGTTGSGTVFALAPPTEAGGAWTKSTLYSFLGGPDGANPLASLIIGNQRTLYGTTNGGGGCSYFGGNCGTVFELASAGPGEPWTETVLHRFAGGADGLSPQGGLAMDATGALFGTTYWGGATGLGTVFQLSPPTGPGGAWRETVIYTFFVTQNGDGYNPVGNVTFGSDGALYGATCCGGSVAAAVSGGTIYRLAPPAVTGGSWTETVLHSFGDDGDGTNPQSGPVFGPDGALYGTTEYSLVPSGRGSVYQLMPPASGPAGGPWVETILHVFPGNHTGGAPYGGVVLGTTGVVYGTTFWGGNTEPKPACRSGCGTVFSLSPPPAAGGAWTANVLHRFTSLNGDGANPQSGLIFGANHMLYGTTDYGGGSAACASCGTVFAMKP